MKHALTILSTFLVLSAAGRAGPLDSTSAVAAVEARLASVVIPTLELRQAEPLDVVDFLVNAARAGVDSTRPDGSASLANPAAGGRAADARQRLVAGLPLITAEFHRITLLEAVRQITQRAGLAYEITDRELLIKNAAGAVLNRARIVGLPPPAP